MKDTVKSHTKTELENNGISESDADQAVNELENQTGKSYSGSSKEDAFQKVIDDNPEMSDERNTFNDGDGGGGDPEDPIEA